MKFFPGGPKVTIQTKKRQDSMFNNMIDRSISPGPAVHNGHSKMTERRSRSNERNAPIATIGNYNTNSSRMHQLTIGPGPQNYDTISSRHIGDKSSKKVIIAKATRSISAEPKISTFNAKRPSHYLQSSVQTKTITLDIGRKSPRKSDDSMSRRSFGTRGGASDSPIKTQRTAICRQTAAVEMKYQTLPSPRRNKYAIMHFFR